MIIIEEARLKKAQEEATARWEKRYARENPFATSMENVYTSKPIKNKEFGPLFLGPGILGVGLCVAYYWFIRVPNTPYDVPKY